MDHWDWEKRFEFLAVGRALQRIMESSTSNVGRSWVQVGFLLLFLDYYHDLLKAQSYISGPS